VLRSRVATIALLALAITNASVIFYLSVPRLATAFLTISGDKVLSQIENGQFVDSDQLDELEKSRNAALGWMPNAKPYYDLGTVQSIRRQRGVSGIGPAVDREIFSLTKKSLTMSPTSGRAWLRLASAELRLNGDTKLLTDALVTSVLTAPVLPLNTFSRLELMLRSAKFEQSSDPRLMFRQMRIAWKLSAENSILYSAASLRRVALFRAALASDPVSYDRYNIMLNQHFTSRR